MHQPDPTSPYNQPPNYASAPPVYDQPPPSTSSSYTPPPNPNPNLNYSPPPNSSPYNPHDQTHYTPPFNYDYSNYNYNSSYTAPSYDNNYYEDQESYGSGVYKYNGGGKGREEESGSVLFDDYGRPINNVSNGREETRKVVKAVPKVDEQIGVQKYRVKLLSEGYGDSDMDVLCQIGLDGIRIMEPSTSRMLKIYPLETVTRWEVFDSYIFAFWAKTSVDAEPRRIRMKSNSYTTNNILDTVTAASIQVKEIGASKPSGSVKEAEQPSEKKKGLTDWVNFIKPGNEEKDHWVPDEAVAKCTACGGAFSAFNRRHHCRNCGDVFCDKCTQGRIALTADDNAQPVRVCDQCLAEVTQRLSNTKEAAVRVTAGSQSHEDLAKKLQEVMNINRKTSSGSVSGGSGTRMREVACPTCTVHLQVQVPASGSETIECSVCQQPFLVNAS